MHLTIAGPGILTGMLGHTRSPRLTCPPHGPHLNQGPTPGTVTLNTSALLIARFCAPAAAIDCGTRSGSAFGGPQRLLERLLQRRA